MYSGNAIWNKYVLSFFSKIVLDSDVFKVMVNSFQTLGAFAHVKFCFRHNK